MENTKVILTAIVVKQDDKESVQVNATEISTAQTVSVIDSLIGFMATHYKVSKIDMINSVAEFLLKAEEETNQNQIEQETK